MTKEQMQEVKNQFDNFDEEEQWAWVVNTDYKDEFTMTLDNDSTSIHFEDDLDADYMLYFKDDIGNRSGLYPLLKSIGINAESV